MQTITVSRVHGIQVNIARFLERSGGTRIRHTVNQERNTSEEFAIATARRLDTQNQRLRGLVTAVSRHTYPVLNKKQILRDGRLFNEESEESRSDFARIWVGYRDYVLYGFFNGFPNPRAYSTHRLLTARCLTNDPLNESQTIVQTVGYDLSRVRDRFPDNIWDQNFKRRDAIRSGRIYGTAMKTDPLYEEFENIATYIGVEIPITGSNQKVQVIQDGRVKFMSLQTEYMEDPATQDAALDIIVQVLNRLRACETT